MPPHSVTPINVCVSHMFVQRAFHPRSRPDGGRRGCLEQVTMSCVSVWMRIWHLLLIDVFFVFLMFLLDELITLVELGLMQICLMLCGHIKLWFHNLDTVSMFLKCGSKKSGKPKRSSRDERRDWALRASRTLACLPAGRNDRSSEGFRRSSNVRGWMFRLWPLFADVCNLPAVLNGARLWKSTGLF